MARWGIRAALLATLCLAATAHARDFYPRTLYQIGLPGRPTVTQITPEGWVNNGWTEFPYYTGTEMKPLDDIALTPAADGRPLIHGDADREGIHYSLEYYSAPLIDSVDIPPQVDVVRVSLRNRDTRDHRVRFWAGIRYPAAPGRWQFTEAFMHWGWRYEFRRNVVAKENQIVAVYPVGYTERLSWPGHIYDGRFGLNPRFTNPEKACALARYDFLLQPGQDTSLVFYYPAEAGPNSYAALLNATETTVLRHRFDAYWDRVLATMPDLKVGNPELSAFLKGNVILGLLQTRYWHDLVHAFPNKNLHPFLDGLELARTVRSWHRLGLTEWEKGAYRSLHSLQKPEIVLHSGRQGRAGTAGVMGLVCERALDLHSYGEAAAETLLWRADSLSEWGVLPGSLRATALECASGAWALRTYADLLEAAGQSEGARLRVKQSDSLWEAARLKVLAVGPSVLLGPQGEALPWLAETRPLTPDLLNLLRPGEGWHVAEGLVTAPSDTAILSWTLSRLQSRPEGDPSTAQELLAVAAHATGQGGLPSGLHVSGRDFGSMFPPDASQGFRTVEAILDRVVVDSASWLLLGRGMMPPRAGDSVSVGPILTRFGAVHVVAHFDAGQVSWAWTSSGQQGIRVRMYAPPGCLVHGTGERYLETDLSSGHAELSWDGTPAGQTLPEWRRQLEPRAASKPTAIKSRSHRRR